MKLTENQIEVMNDLLRKIDLYPEHRGWSTPLDLGGTNGSHHSGTLNALARKGLVQFKQRGAEDPPEGENGRKRFVSRGSKCYRLTPAGIEWIKTWREGAEPASNQLAELVPWVPPTVTLHGAPITPELQLVFGHLTGGTVRGLALGNDGIHVQYEDGTELIWSPRPAPGPMPFGALLNV